jgi:CRP/FNR family cyclic AMP-dependent transcriptional regulator
VKTVSTARRKRSVFRPAAFLAKTGLGRTILDLKKGQTVFSQGDAANAVFYVQKGKIRLTVISKRGKEATISLLGSGSFLGEECIATIQPQRMATAIALTPARLPAMGKCGADLAACPREPLESTWNWWVVRHSPIPSRLTTDLEL